LEKKVGFEPTVPYGTPDFESEESGVCLYSFSLLKSI
jgi:hypothetical protein